MKDAWRQLHELYRKFTRTWMVRDNLKVRALATDRCVELSLGRIEMNPKFQSRMMRFETTKRNVSTMRELALTLWAACDFVDESNPTWAGNPGYSLSSVESFEVDR